MFKQLQLKTVLLLGILMAGSGYLFAEETSVTATKISSTSGTWTGTGNETWNYSQSGGATGQNVVSGYFQIGTKNSPASSVTLSTSDISGTISKIVVRCASYNGLGTISTTVGGEAFGTQSQALPSWTGSSGDNITFEGSASGPIIITMTNGTGGRAMYINKITVTYTSGGSTPTVATPTFSVEEGSYEETKSVEISCSTEGATIYYTIDGTDPTNQSTEYEGAISIVETTTLKAIAYVGDDASDIATATYTILDPNRSGTQNNPYTVAQARAAIDANTGVTGVYATGIVSEIKTTGSNYITFYMVDNDGDEDYLQAYKCGGDDIANVEEGDVVVVSGDLTKYGDIYQFSSGCTLESLTHPAVSRTLTVSTLSNVEMFVFAGEESENLFNGTGSATVLSGTGVMLSVSAENGYVLKSLIVDGVEHVNDITESDVYLFTMPNHDVTITASAIVAPVVEDYALYTGDLVEGDYLIVYSEKAMKNTVSSNRLGYEDVTATNGVISTDKAEIVWHIAKSGDYWTIYNVDAAKYAASNGTKNQAQMLTDGTDDKALWTVSTSDGTYEFVNKGNAAANVNANLRENGTYGFACYSTSTGGALSLYKKVATENVAVTDAGWTTYVTKHAVSFDDETAYVVTDATTATATMACVTSVPANTPVLVKGTEGTATTVVASILETAPEAPATNLLQVSDGTVTGNGSTIYCLANGSYGVGFYRVANGVSVPSGKAYLQIETDGNSRQFIGFSGSEPTGIDEMVSGKSANGKSVYDLQGRRVVNAVKGLYIVNGKKMIVK